MADTYKKRASNYANVFDTSIGYARPRYTNGKFKEDFSLLSTHGEGFIEGNALNYSFYVPQDVNGMIQLMGGEQAFITKMDSLFTMHLPDEFFCRDRRRNQRRITRRLCTRQRTQPSHPILIRMDQPALENPILATRDHE